MKLKEVNYFGFDHAAVDRKFNGGLKYIRTFQIRGNTWAVYKVANPDRELGHKDYMMLAHDPMTRQGVVSGCTPEDMEKERFQDAVLCTECDTVLYSINRHHYHTCGCPNDTMVDGGKDYLRCGGMSMDKVAQVRLDLITGELVGSQSSEKLEAEKKPAAKPRKRSPRSEKKSKA